MHICLLVGRFPRVFISYLPITTTQGSFCSAKHASWDHISVVCCCHLYTTPGHSKHFIYADCLIGYSKFPVEIMQPNKTSMSSRASKPPFSQENFCPGDVKKRSGLGKNVPEKHFSYVTCLHQDYVKPMLVLSVFLST